MKPISDITDPPPRPTREPKLPRISDRQVEIMTATLCEVIANKNLPPEEGKALVGELIGAMVKQVTRLNEAVEAANNPVGVIVKVTINNIGQPVVEAVEEEDAGLIPRSAIEADLRADRAARDKGRDSL